MVQISKYRRLSRAAKGVIPLVAPLFRPQCLQNALSLSETFLALLQGKGAGTGWDIKSETQIAAQFINPGEVVLDVGANRGEWSQEVYKAKDGKVEIYMFEPQTTCYTYLQSMVDKGAHLIKCAAGEKPGTSVFYTPGTAAGNASIHFRKDTCFADEKFVPVEIKIVTIDDVIAQNKIKKVAFMKMDIEGHELFALRGASHALTDGVIRALSFEFGTGNVNSRTYFRDIWDLLTEKHYSLFRIIPGGKRVPVTSYYEDMEYFRGVTNYIAVRTEEGKQA